MSAQSNDNSRYLSEYGYAQAGENNDDLNSIKSGVQVANPPCNIFAENVKIIVIRY